MTEQHPVTPPPGLIDEWIEKFKGDHPIYVAIQAAQWGADQELEATLGLMETLNIRGVDYVRNARRPRRPEPPPTLKEQALEALKRQSTRSVPSLVSTNDCDTIRRALEALPND